jgi:Na+-driven multidrug efflux pump
MMIAFRMGIRGASIATVITECVPAAIIIVGYFCGKFSVKPKLSQLLCKFSPVTWTALRVGVSQLVCNLSVLIPSVIVRKLIGDASGSEFNDALAGYNATVRIFQLTNSVIIAFTNGYLPAASYSYAGKGYERWLRLGIHAFWLTFAWGAFTAILSWTIPNYIAMIFSSAENYVKWGGEMIRVGNALGFLVNGRFLGVSMLQSLQMGLVSTGVSLLCHLVSVIAFALLLYYTKRDDGVRILWSYGLSYTFGFIMVICVLIKPVLKIYRGWKGTDKEMELDEKNVAMLDGDNLGDVEGVKL